MIKQPFSFLIRSNFHSPFPIIYFFCTFADAINKTRQSMDPEIAKEQEGFDDIFQEETEDQMANERK